MAAEALTRSESPGSLDLAIFHGIAGVFIGIPLGKFHAAVSIPLEASALRQTTTAHTTYVDIII